MLLSEWFSYCHPAMLPFWTTILHTILQWSQPNCDFNVQKHSAVIRSPFGIIWVSLHLNKGIFFCHWQPTLNTQSSWGLPPSPYPSLGASSARHKEGAVQHTHTYSRILLPITAKIMYQIYWVLARPLAGYQNIMLPATGTLEKLSLPRIHQDSNSCPPETVTTVSVQEHIRGPPHLIRILKR